MKGPFLNDDGMEAARQAKYLQGFTLQKIAELSFVGIGTVKRFVNGKRVRADNFEALCKTLGLIKWIPEPLPRDQELDSTTFPAKQRIAENQNIATYVNHAPPISTEPTPDNAQQIASVIISGSISIKNRAEVKKLLNIIASRLLDTIENDIETTSENAVIGFYGTLHKNKRPEIEGLIGHIKSKLHEPLHLSFF